MALDGSQIIQSDWQFPRLPPGICKVYVARGLRFSFEFCSGVRLL